MACCPMTQNSLTMHHKLKRSHVHLAHASGLEITTRHIIGLRSARGRVVGAICIFYLYHYGKKFGTGF